MGRLTVIQLLPALSSGGVERTTLDVGQALVAAGHRSIVVSAGGRLLPTLLAQGSEHVELDIGRKSLATLRHVRSLRRLFARQRPDVVHARSRLPAWLCRAALGPGGRRTPAFVTSVHGLNSPGWYSGILTRGERVICVSDTVRRHVLRHWPRTDPARLVIIEPGIDTAQFARVEARAPREDTGVQLLMPGRGTRLKGHAHAIALLAALRANGMDARLRLLGAEQPGREAYLAQLRAQAKTLGVGSHLRIEPPTSDIAEAYRDCDLVLQLSDKPESYGRTVVEALSVGRPVVGWALGGVGELLSRHFPQGAVPPGDGPALVAAVRACLSSTAPILPTLAQSLAGMQAQTLKVYDSLSR